MNPKVIVFEDHSEISSYVVEIIQSEIKRKPSLNLGLPTGRTVIPVYKELINFLNEEKKNLAKIKTFNLDEYIGVNPKEKISFEYFLDKNLLGKIKIPKKNINFLNGSAVNLKKESEDYEKKIKKAGGLDLTLLGIGKNGHIAFNEPGSPFYSRTREVILTYSTRAANFGKILSFIKAPKRALTVGIGTILESKKIILIATGKHKAQAIRDMLESEPNTKCPASALQKHKDVLVLLDKGAASLLKK